ncbi:hypothetical protein SAMN05421757_101800 [Tropicimonas sediminicola]|uniref:Uncharacterized protein n=1 Tax=Tropicimonas sediminicola TaxID=1031541 RepID=A0A239DEZ6_9RHOB|nr:hypothetical protein SAMN05421757_101800 [Tropicimonas sediminicola]
MRITTEDYSETRFIPLPGRQFLLIHAQDLARFDCTKSANLTPKQARETEMVHRMQAQILTLVTTMGTNQVARNGAPFTS